MAYRSQRERKSAQAPGSGVVADMVRQFADRYAFTRELVQNAIDAGASHVAVAVQLRSDGTVVSTVVDDGEGMTRATIEGPLLTLFSSSKDKARGKIGKYGVGFVSVFAIDPREVVVESWCQNESWVLRLWPDHRYELARGHERQGSGTSVALVQSLDAEQFAPHANQVRQALRRWCRHVGVPLTFRQSTPASAADEPLAAAERIDRPLELPAVACVVDGQGDEQIVVAPSAGSDFWSESAGEAMTDPGPALSPGSQVEPSPLEQSASFAGFYNRGLTLFETAEPLRPTLQGIRFKALSPKLQHTLSRDNVKRDAEFERIIERVEDLARHQLRPRLRSALAEAAQAAAIDPQSARRHAAVFIAACSSPTMLDPDELMVPVAHPVGNRSTFSLAELHALGDGRVYVAATSSPLTEALAADHQPVLLAAERAVLSWVAHRVGAAAVRQVDQSFLLADEIAPLALSASDRTLCSLLHDALRQLGAPTARVGITMTRGASPYQPVIAVPPGTEVRGLLQSANALTAWWPRWARPVDLLLVAGHDWIRRARLRAEREPLVAAHLLTRALAVQERGPLSSRANAALLEAACTWLSSNASATGGSPRRRSAGTKRPERRRP